MHRLCLQKKEVVKKSYEDKGASHEDEGPLDDPIEEKLRQQRYIAIRSIFSLPFPAAQLA